ncbi:hypothetical protein [Kitasatospora sp. NPDC056181]|uniref:hypothetical protein n=1 Tax=Kitasatospora sp. NPDC056181 TaxID=3345737 RepID=UPI0035E1E4D4
MRSAAMRGRVAMPERLRVDRQLEDAVIQSPGPFHLAGVFGLDEKSAVRLRGLGAGAVAAGR